MRLELLRIDVLSVRKNDHILASARDDKTPVGLKTPEIAGVKPAVYDRLPRRLLVPVIALHDDGSTDADLADSVFVGRIDLDANTANRLADGADARWLPDGRRCRCGRSLRESVGLKHRVSETIQISRNDRIETRTTARQNVQLRSDRVMNPAKQFASVTRVRKAALQS